MDIALRIQALIWGRGMTDSPSYEETGDLILAWVGDSTTRLACFQAAFNTLGVKRTDKVLALAERFAKYAEIEPVAEPTQGEIPPKKRGRPKGSKNK